MPLRFAYNTNGTANHRLDDALELIADSGYNGVALTLDHHHLDPFAPDLQRRAEQLAAELDRLKLGLVIETGARYLLDPRRKHEPTLLHPEAEGRARRIEFLSRAIEIAAICGAEAVSFWAGVPQPEVERPAAWDYLLKGVAQVAEAAERRRVVVALEPEPGMLVETIDDYKTVKAVAPSLQLALDLGHCIVTGDREPHDAVREMRSELGTVTIEDMRRGVHDHLPFGEGDLDVAAALRSLHEINFTKLVCVELSRDSHRAHTMVGDAIAFLRNVENELTANSANTRE
jgi:sugar phosphate isomerase/epimerase